MSKPFAVLLKERSEGTDAELVEQSFHRLQRWAQFSSGKLVSLDEVAWLGALIFKSCSELPDFPKLEAGETVSGGSKVHTILAQDSISTKDAAG